MCIKLVLSYLLWAAITINVDAIKKNLAERQQKSGGHMNLAPRMSGKKNIKYLANNLCTVYQICMYILCAYTNPGMLHLQGFT